MSKLLTRIRCRIGWHKCLDIINTFGSAQHIGCPDCGRQFGIHHDMRVVIPWDSALASMYESFGHDVKGPLAKWQKYRIAVGKVVSL